MRQGYSQFRHVLEDHVWAPDSQRVGTAEAYQGKHREVSLLLACRYILTDVIIKAKQGTAEFCMPSKEASPSSAQPGPARLPYQGQPKSSRMMARRRG